MRRSFSLPSDLEARLVRGLRESGAPVDAAGARAREILSVSDHFLADGAALTPWEKPATLAGYLTYFFVLNFIRARAVAAAGRDRGFFEGLENSVDWGAGPATATLALEGLSPWKERWLIERAEAPRRFVEAHLAPAQGLRWEKELPTRLPPAQKTLGICSYSLTETDRLPGGFEKLEALMLIEPSTQDDGRRLLERRRALIDAGFSMWAPCPHQGPCPLLEQSPRDWCHDRVFFEPPAWLAEIEKHLPMKNQTLTFSYLLARKTPAPSLAARTGRLIGDTLREKGKDRQLICRGPKREFLAWMHRDGGAPELPRGSLVELPPTVEEKSNEVRVKDPIKVLSAPS